MDKQSEAEFLANELESGKFTPNILQNEFALRERAATELRRLHDANEELLEALIKLRNAHCSGTDIQQINDAYDNADIVIAKAQDQAK